MIKLLVLDFDGTLADTRKIVVDTLKKLFKKYKYNVDNDFWDYIGDDSVRNTMKKLSRNKSELDRASEEFVEEKTKNEDVRLCKGVISLKEIRKKKIIVSNSVTSYIKHVLKNHKITFFREIYGADRFKDKTSMMKKIRKRNKLKPREIVFVGDRAKDIEHSKRIGCVSVAISNKYSWGSRKALLKAKPDFIISDLREVKSILDKLEK